MNSKLRKLLYKQFHIKEHNTSVRKEFLAGVTNYFTTIYLLLLVPEILIGAFPGAIDSNGDIVRSLEVLDGITAGEMIVALTAVSFIVAGISSVAMGTFINIPFVLGPSLGVATFITYTVCMMFGYSYYQALAIVFISGVGFLALSVTGLEEKLSNAIPLNLKFAVTAGIGFFIAFTGLQKAHILEVDADGAMTLFSVVDFSDLHTKSAVLALVVVLLIAVMLKRNIHGAIFFGKLICIVLAIPLGLISEVDNSAFEYGFHFDEVMFRLDFNGLIDLSDGTTAFSSVVSLTIVVFSILIMDVFETMSMIIAAENYVKTSNADVVIKKRIPQILETDSGATIAGSMLGMTTVSTYIESTAGIVEGGRTGLTSVVTGCLFLFSVFITPLAAMVPSAATATTLIMAGIMMISVIRHIDFEDYVEAVPAFLTMFTMPMTNSLLMGIAIGVISYVIIQALNGKALKLNYLLYIMALLLFIVLYFVPR